MGSLLKRTSCHSPTGSGEAVKGHNRETVERPAFSEPNDPVMSDGNLAMGRLDRIVLHDVDVGLKLEQSQTCLH